MQHVQISPVSHIREMLSNIEVVIDLLLIQKIDLFIINLYIYLEIFLSSRLIPIG